MTGRFAACAMLVALGAAPQARADEPLVASSETDASSMEGQEARGLELALFDEGKLVRLELVVEVGGKPVSEMWAATGLFQRLLARCDRNADGSLDAEEAARLPSPFALRQLLWHPLATAAGLPPPLETIDADKDRKVNRDELVDFYRRAGAGGVFVGTGRPPATRALTDALLAMLDTDGDRCVGEPEFKAAEQLLARWDRNDDQLLGASELVADTAYPGAAGATFGTSGEKTTGEAAAPFLVLPARLADTQWTAQVLARLDRNGDGRLSAREVGWELRMFGEIDADADGQLMADELAAWRKRDPDGRWVVRLGKPNPETAPGQSLSSPQRTAGEPWHVLQVGRVWLSLRADEGQLPALAAAARERCLARYAQADTNGDKSLDGKEAGERSREDLGQMIAAADDNGDGQLTEQELIAWLAFQEKLVAGHVLLTVLDHGAGLFELLDADHNGGLSVRELRGAWQRLEAAGCVTEGYLDQTKLPRQLIAAISRGHPQSPLGTSRGVGPEWFVAMDRNGDGDVSAREFLGPTSEFSDLDHDGDGLLSAAEVDPPAEKQAAK